MNKQIFIVLGVCLVIASCQQLTNATDFITQPTAKEIYARDFEDADVIFNTWTKNFEVSKNDSLKINLPYLEQVQLHNTNLQSYSYNINLSEGELFNLQIESDVDSIQFFSELFKIEGDSITSFKSLIKSKPNETNMAVPIKESATYKLIIQPEIYASTKASLKIFTSPTYYFPVAGKTSKAIQSFWGASRDGGKRSHKGVDIFAERGTPVIAAVDGYVSSTGNKGLGGKQVWLRDGLFGASLYYAHLDSIATQSGKKVKIGDTLGFVGNTGNAKYTPPHLHFGIYKGYNGAVNPLPFIKNAEIPETDNLFVAITPKAIIKNSVANIRIGPSSKFDKITQLKRNDTITVLGKLDDWLHIKTGDGQKAFVFKTLTESLP